MVATSLIHIIPCFLNNFFLSLSFCFPFFYSCFYHCSQTDLYFSSVLIQNVNTVEWKYVFNFNLEIILLLNYSLEIILFFPSKLPINKY